MLPSPMVTKIIKALIYYCIADFLIMIKNLVIITTPFIPYTYMHYIYENMQNVYCHIFIKPAEEYIHDWL